MANGKAGPPLGNDNATKSKPFLAMLRKCLTDDDLNKPEGKRRLYLIANQLIDSAADGEEWAIKELANRLDGKAMQGVEVSAPNGGALNFFDPAMVRNLSTGEMGTLKELLAKAASGMAEGTE